MNERIDLDRVFGTDEHSQLAELFIDEGDIAMRWINVLQTTSLSDEEIVNHVQTGLDLEARFPTETRGTDYISQILSRNRSGLIKQVPIMRQVYLLSESNRP